MRIVPVSQDSPEFQEFIDFPWSIYGRDHLWVPPIKDAVRAELSPINPFFTHGEAQAFLCVKGGKTLGRIVASVDKNLADGDVGHFGYFEAVDEPAVAAALLGAAEEWVRARGRQTIHGPVNLNIYTGYRIQTEGFERKPFMGEPRSPRYYRALLEGAGYAQHAHWRSWDLPSAFFAPLKAAAEQAYEQAKPHLGEYRVEYFSREKAQEDCRALHPAVMEIFRENYGFSDIGEDEYLQVYGFTAQLLDPGFPRIVDSKGRTVAFCFGYPDYADAFIAIDGDSSRLGEIFARPAPSALVLHTIGIVEEHRKGGVAHLIQHTVGKRLGNPYSAAIGALAKEGRTVYDKIGKATRAYAVFSKALGR